MPKLITGDKFIAGLMELGIVDNRTRKITIEAEVGEAIIVTTVEKFGDDRLLKMLEGGHVVVTEDPQQSVCR